MIFKCFGLYASVKHEEAVNSIFEEMVELQIKPVGIRELERIRKAGKYAIAKHFETNQGHVSAIETKNDTGRTPKIGMANWNKVTPQKIQEVAQHYLPKADGRYVLMIKDPLKV